MMASCKNTKTTEPTPEEVQQQKVALADSVLSYMDTLADLYFDAASNSFMLKSMELTDAEKMVKPDYLLDPSVANTCVTKSQKINALAIYSVDNSVRKIFGLPCEEVKEVITKLAAEVNHPIDMDLFMSDFPTSEIVKREYEICKERGDLAYFWQFQFAIIAETSYVIVNNPELFFSRITEEQWQAYRSRTEAIVKAVSELAQYDEEMAALEDFRIKSRITSKEEWEKSNVSLESAIQFRISNRDKYIARRNALLQ